MVVIDIFLLINNKNVAKLKLPVMYKTKSEDSHNCRDLSRGATASTEASGLTFTEKVSDKIEPHDY